ncbi:hypothetical protein IV203_033211 [Nitzschia inconspicua]|uniref:Uncharacterized protein n=1 Tax=Nitzschia inconspicua TaxID=303405 RepID=A0A9K3KL46_9STRA|nr:hypothetical protein IV203_033211 [Nitzschia inconspicua]
MKAHKAKPCKTKSSPRIAGKKLEEIIIKAQTYLWEMLESGIENGQFCVYIILTRKVTTMQSVGYLVHEAKHVGKTKMKLSLPVFGVTVCCQTFGSVCPNSNEEAAECFKVSLQRKKILMLLWTKFGHCWPMEKATKQNDLVKAAGYKRSDSI